MIGRQNNGSRATTRIHPQAFNPVYVAIISTTAYGFVPFARRSE